MLLWVYAYRTYCALTIHICIANEQIKDVLLQRLQCEYDQVNNLVPLRAGWRICLTLDLLDQMSYDNRLLMIYLFLTCWKDVACVICVTELRLEVNIAGMVQSTLQWDVTCGIFCGLNMVWWESVVCWCMNLNSD